MGRWTVWSLVIVTFLAHAKEVHRRSSTLVSTEPCTPEGKCRQCLGLGEGLPHFIDSDLVISTVFTTKQDPIRARVSCRDCDDYYGMWLQSVKLLNLTALIFHDGIREGHIERHSSSNIHFCKVGLGHSSTNDERFKLYYVFLTGQDLSLYPSYRILPEEELQSFNSRINNVFFTDIANVEFLRNPFQLLGQYSNFLFIGSEGKVFSPWMENKVKVCKMQAYRFDRSVNFNAGIIGGKTTYILPFLQCYMKIATSLSPAVKQRNCNMAILHAALVGWLDKKRVFTGPPLHTRFNKFEYNKTDMYIRHK